MTKFIHIQLNEIETDAYVCTAVEIPYTHYKYIRRNFRHFFFDSGEVKRIVMSNIDITMQEARSLANKHAQGKFIKEDTTKWD